MDTKPTVPKGLFEPPYPRSPVTPPATAEQISRAERALNVTFPAALIATLKVQNGGAIRLSSYNTLSPVAKEHGLEKNGFSTLAGVDPNDDGNLVEQSKLAHDEWGLPKGLVPLDGDGHWWCCLNYRACGPKGEPVVTHVDLEMKYEFKVAGSFHELLMGLFQDEESLKPALIALDEGAPKGVALGETLERLGCTVKRFEGKANPRFPLPPTWCWRKFRGLLRDEPVWIQFQKNKLYSVSFPKTDQRDDTHPMLTVSVKPADEQECLRELLTGLGKGAVLIRGVS